MGCCTHSSSQISQRTTAGDETFFEKICNGSCVVPGLMKGPCVERKGAGPLSFCRLGLSAQSARTRFGSLL